MDDDRAIAPVIEYVLIIGFASILLVSVSVSSAALLAEANDREAERALQEISEVLVDELDAVARLGAHPTSTTVESRIALPDTIGSRPYSLAINESNTLQVNDYSNDITVIRPLQPYEFEVVPGELTGGPLLVRIEEGEMVISRDR